MCLLYSIDQITILTPLRLDHLYCNYDIKKMKIEEISMKDKYQPEPYSLRLGLKIIKMTSSY